MDPQLLSPVRHRSAEAQADLNLVRVREALVDGRTALVNAARGLMKARVNDCPLRYRSDGAWNGRQRSPAELRAVLRPLIESVEALTEKIRECDRKLEQIARDRYPETKLLRQVKGVGTLIALTFVLTLEDTDRFARSRDVGCYVGLRPKRSESGESQPQLRITKEGDAYLRKMLVQGAHYILGYRGRIRI